MSSTLIELKQTDPNSIIQRNGLYRCTIQDNLTLHPGDQIAMKFCAIDSASTDSNNVIIDEDINLSVGFCRYNYYLNEVPMF